MIGQPIKSTVSHPPSQSAVFAGNSEPLSQVFDSVAMKNKPARA